MFAPEGSGPGVIRDTGVWEYVGAASPPYPHLACGRDGRDTPGHDKQIRTRLCISETQKEYGLVLVARLSKER